MTTLGGRFILSPLYLIASVEFVRMFKMEGVMSVTKKNKSFDDVDWISYKYALNHAIARRKWYNMLKFNPGEHEHMEIIKYSNDTSPIKNEYEWLVPERITTFTSINGEGAVRSCWDTGFVECGITKKVVERLHLTPLNDAVYQMDTAYGYVYTNAYLVDIDFHNGFVAKNVLALETDLGDDLVEFIIGMSIITNGNFSITRSPENIKFEFEFTNFSES